VSEERENVRKRERERERKRERELLPDIHNITSHTVPACTRTIIIHHFTAVQSTKSYRLISYVSSLIQ